MAEKVLLKGRKTSMEYQMETIMGERFVICSAVPDKNDQGEIETILLIIKDDTDQKIATNNMQKKHRKVTNRVITLAMV